MSNKVGLSCKLYENTGTWATPTWSEITITKDVTQSSEVGTADVSSRGSGGFRATLPTLQDLTLEFSMPWDESDARFEAVRAAHFAKTTIELAAMSGDITTSGEEGLRADWYVTQMTRVETLEEGVMVNFSAKPDPSTNTPTWYVVP